MFSGMIDPLFKLGPKIPRMGMQIHHVWDLGTGHKVEGGGGAMKNWGWVAIFQNVEKGGSGKFMHCIRGGSGKIIHVSQFNK